MTASLLEADLVDRLVLFQAPVLLGEGGLPAFGTHAGNNDQRRATLASARLRVDR